MPGCARRRPIATVLHVDQPSAAIWDCIGIRAYLILPEEQSIRPVEIDGPDDIAALIGFETLESDAVGPDGDRLYFDEECFIRGTSGRFQIDSIIPVAGRGVLVGTAEDGERLRDVSVPIEDLRARTKFE